MRDPNMPACIPNGSIYEYFWNALRDAMPPEERDRVLTPEEKARLEETTARWMREHEHRMREGLP